MYTKNWEFGREFEESVKKILEERIKGEIKIISDGYIIEDLVEENNQLAKLFDKAVKDAVEWTIKDGWCYLTKTKEGLVMRLSVDYGGEYFTKDELIKDFIEIPDDEVLALYKELSEKINKRIQYYER